MIGGSGPARPGGAGADRDVAVSTPWLNIESTGEALSIYLSTVRVSTQTHNLLAIRRRRVWTPSSTSLTRKVTPAAMFMTCGIGADSEMAGRMDESARDSKRGWTEAREEEEEGDG